MPFRIRKTLQRMYIHLVFATAHLVYLVERLFAAPQYLFLVAFISLTLFASLSSWNPFFWEKIGLNISSQKEENYLRMIRISQVFGDPFFAEQLYAQILPNLSTQHDRQLFREEAYPLEKLELLRAFWTSVLQLQPTSREVFVALTIIHHSLQEKEAEQSTLSTWKLLEPNDARLGKF